MICHCGHHLTGTTALIGEPMCAANGYGDDYLLLVTCPRCQATHSVRMWQSEAALEEDLLLDGDLYTATNSLNDMRPVEAA